MPLRSASAFSSSESPRRDQPLDPLWEGEGGGMHCRIVIIGFELGGLEAYSRQSGAGRGAEAGGPLTRPGERHEATDIGRHDGEVEPRLREVLCKLIQRFGDLP